MWKFLLCNKLKLYKELNFFLLQLNFTKNKELNFSTAAEVFLRFLIFLQNHLIWLGNTVKKIQTYGLYDIGNV